MKKIIYLLVGILLLSVVSAMNCTYDSKPFLTLTQLIDWNCVSDIKDGRCYSMVLFEGELLHIYPEISIVQGQGIIDYFVLNNKIVSVKFDTTDLYEDYNYTMRVVCSDSSNIDEFDTVVSPVRRDLSEVAYRGIWIKQNMSVIFLITIIIIIALILVKIFMR